jgi:hypothetical protein
MAGEEGTMGKRLGISAAAIAVMALVVGAVSPALGSSSQGATSTSSGQTIRVTAVFTEFDPNIDVGAAGFSLGDEVVFSGNLLRNGQQVGRIGVVCTFVSTANADRVEAQCPTTSILPGGQITTQGTIVNRSLNFTLPITPLQCSEQGGLPTGGLPEAPGGKFGQGARICDEARIGLHKST